MTSAIYAGAQRDASDADAPLKLEEIPALTELRNTILPRVKLLNQMRMTTVGFGESANPRIQSLLSTHNDRMGQIASISITGTCHWNEERGEQHEIRFIRDGFKVVSSCGSSKRNIDGAVATLDAATDEAFVDSQYLYSLATFDPAAYSKVTETTITQKNAKGDSIDVSVFEVQSPGGKLFFDKTDGLLGCISVQGPDSYVGLLDHKDIQGVQFPMTIRVVSRLDASRLSP